MHPNTLTVIKVSILAVAFAILGAISVGYVAAQTASSTETVEPAVVVEQPVVMEEDAVSTASSTGATETVPDDTPPAEAEADNPQEAEQASTTPQEDTSAGGDTPSAITPAPEGEVLGASDTEAATSTPEEAEEPEPVVAPPGPYPLSMSTAVSIAALQDAYFGQHGKYLQILPHNTLPSHESGTVQELLGSTIADNAYVDVYENVYGKGYQIFFEEDGVIYSAGYGPEAQDRTFTYTLPVLVASSTSTEL